MGISFVFNGITGDYPPVSNFHPVDKSDIHVVSQGGAKMWVITNEIILAERVTKA